MTPTVAQDMLARAADYIVGNLWWQHSLQAGQMCPHFGADLPRGTIGVDRTHHLFGCPRCIRSIRDCPVCESLSDALAIIHFARSEVRVSAAHAQSKQETTR